MANELFINYFYLIIRHNQQLLKQLCQLRIRHSLHQFCSFEAIIEALDSLSLESVPQEPSLSNSVLLIICHHWSLEPVLQFQTNHNLSSFCSTEAICGALEPVLQLRSPNSLPQFCSTEAISGALEPVLQVRSHHSLPLFCSTVEPWS